MKSTATKLAWAIPGYLVSRNKDPKTAMTSSESSASFYTYGRAIHSDRSARVGTLFKRHLVLDFKLLQIP